MKRRVAEILLIVCAIAVGLWLATRRQIPELDWSLGKGRLRIDGIRIGMSQVAALDSSVETEKQGQGLANR